MNDFASTIKAMLVLSGTTLRDFCRTHDLDASYISKISRGLLPPPVSERIIEQYADAFNVRKGSPARQRFIDLAAAANGILPPDLRHPAVYKELPALFRRWRKMIQTKKGHKCQ